MNMMNAYCPYYYYYYYHQYGLQLTLVTLGSRTSQYRRRMNE